MINKRRRLSPRGRSNRSAKYQLPPDAKIEYKNLPLIAKYLSERGKVLSRRITGINGKRQREMTKAIKKARYLALLPVGGSKRR